MFKRLCVIGTGLIGGSIARAARQQGLCRQIVALGLPEHLPELQTAQDLQVIDHYYTQPAQALAGCDCVIIATPVGAVSSVFKTLAEYAADNPGWLDQVIISDACSTKGSVLAAAEKIFTKLPARLVLAHPIAGAERSGVTASFAELFQGRRLIITPLPESDPAAVAQISQFWQAIGSSVSFMSVEQHDTVLAATSHLPHILAFALTGMLGRRDEQEEIFKYAAGGFKDFTRIASSDPTMWQNICIANAQEILPLLQQYCAELGNIADMLQAGQAQQLHDTFSYAKNARQRFLDKQ